LFETLQDRLVKELRSVGVSTLAEANEYLEWTSTVSRRPLEGMTSYLPCLGSMNFCE
jgi:hypothetical protein